MAIDFGRVNYASTTPPNAYRCTTCGAHGCKLWRAYQTCANHTKLMCCDCAGTSQKTDISRIDADGRIPVSLGKYPDGSEAIQWSDQIGWRVPAVPTEEGYTFWGYSSVPMPGVEWWKRLPNRAS